MRLADDEALEPAERGPEPLETGDDLVEASAEREAERRRGECVVHVVEARDGEPHPGAAVRGSRA